jgi:hypothetical protein
MVGQWGVGDLVVDAVGAAEAGVGVDQGLDLHPQGAAG